METLRLTQFEKIDLRDPFFDSLKAQYEEFPDWFLRKSKEPVYVVDKEDSKNIRGFVYLKVEDGPIDDVDPPLLAARRLKVGTLKVDAHGTKLGERIVKKIFDHALQEHVTEIYVTVFDTHSALIEIFKRYGFVEKGNKTTRNGTELVLVRSMEIMSNDIRKDYPFIHIRNKKFWLLAIYPEYHTKLLPDSLLKTETSDIIRDVSYTNTIHKIYLAKLSLSRMKRGDVVVIYRTTDIEGRARFRSVATSVCVVEETRQRNDFPNLASFLRFAQPHSVFSEDELREWFNSGSRLYAVKMMYNLALPKRPNRDALLDRVGITEQPRWDLRELSFEQFTHIMELGNINESVIVD